MGDAKDVVRAVAAIFSSTVDRRIARNRRTPVSVIGDSRFSRIAERYARLTSFPTDYRNYVIDELSRIVTDGKCQISVARSDLSFKFQTVIIASAANKVDTLRTAEIAGFTTRV